MNLTNINKIIIIAILFCIIIIMIYSVYSFQKLKSEIFMTTNNYPELKIIENNWKIISNEIPSFDIDKLDEYPTRSRTAWNNDEATKLATNMKSTWMHSWQNGKKWLNFPLMYHNKVIDTSDKICPKTIDILKKIPSIQVAGFSVLLPDSKLDVHTDLTGKKNNSMACNLLLTDNNANLYVNNTKYKHELGKAVIFDSNIEHYADNQDIDKIRTILYIDFRTDTIFGTRQKGIGLATKLGYPTVNIKLSKPIDCGVYIGDSEYGVVIIFVLKDNRAECHYKEYTKDIDNLDIIYIWNVKKVPAEKNSIIDIYNKGCLK